MLLLAIPAAVLAFRALPWAVASMLALLPVYLVKQSVLGIPVTALEVLILGATVGAALGGWLKWRVGALGRLALPTLALVVLWVVSATLSDDARAGFGAIKAWLVEPILLAALVVYASRSDRARWIMVGGLLAGAAVLSLYGIAEKLFGFGLPPDGRLNSVFVPANYHAMLTAPVLALCLPLLRRIGGSVRWLVALAAAVVGIALLLTQSYGGFLSVSVAVLVWLSTLPVPQRRVGFILVALVALAVVASLGRTEKFHLLGKFGERSPSSVRVQIWRTSTELIRQHPLLGVGPNAFEAPYREAVPKLYWPPLEWLVAQPHSLYFALLTETGVLGFAAFVWLLVGWWRAALTPIRSLAARPWALAALLSLLAILVHGFVDTPLFKNDLSALFAFLLALPFPANTQTETGRT